MKNKLAMFDLDGTLFDTTYVNYYSYKQALEKFGHTLEYDYFCRECSGRHYKDFLLNILGPSSEIFEQVHNEKKQLYSSNLSFAKMNHHLFNIIDGLKNNYHIALVTTASQRNCMELLNYFSVADKFDLIITNSDVQKTKPHPEGYLKAMDHFKVSPKDSIIFEDSKTGIQAAMNSGASVFIATKQF